MMNDKFLFVDFCPDIANQIAKEIRRMIVVNKRYREKGMNIGTMASELEITPTLLSAVVKSKFKSSFSSFINKLRVDEAKEMLLSGKFAGMNVEDIGYMVGFSTRSTFYNAFAKFAGTTPNVYRKKNVNE